MIINDTNYSVFAVIPAYNEGTRIASVIEETKNFVDEVIVVNDCSSDNTSDIANALNITVIDLSVNAGVGNATRVGCDFAIEKKADIIITLDADGQHFPSDIPKMLDCMVTNNLDLVKGDRLNKGRMPFTKKFGSWLLSQMTMILFRSKLNDPLSGFHLIKASVYPKIRWDYNRYVFLSEFIYGIMSKGLALQEVKIQTINLDKIEGMKVKDGIKTILVLLILKFGLPKKIISVLNLDK